MLKFLFLRSFEPYCGYIRSWIFKAELNDPYKEFIVEYFDNPQPNQHVKTDISIDFPLASVRVMLFIIICEHYKVDTVF